MPASGKSAIGSSAVTSIATASVIHHVAIQPIAASVARPAWLNATTVPSAARYSVGSAQ